MTLVTVFREKYARSYPQLDADKPLRPIDKGHVLDLGQALDRPYSTDAHFSSYRSPNGHRLNHESLKQGTPIDLEAIVFDVDGAGHAATPQWRKEERAKVVALAAVHPEPYFYETRGGYRLVYRQQAPTVLETAADAAEWSRIYAIAVAHLEQRFSIVADPACSDWQRLYRLPRATRDPGGLPENHPYWGDHNKIGTLFLEASRADVTKAQKAAPNSFRKPREFAAYGGNGDGLMFWLLKLGGDIVGEAPRGGWICRCPNRRQHTSVTCGSDSTVVYRPKPGEEIGVVVCKHAHCVKLKTSDWLRLFTEAERDAARQAAGITFKERAA